MCRRYTELYGPPRSLIRPNPVPELESQFRNRGFETFQDDLSKPVAAFVARLGFRRDLHMSAEPAEPPGGSLWLL